MNPAILAFQGRERRAPAPWSADLTPQASASSLRVSASSCGQRLGRPDDGDEVGVARPAGYDVLVQVVGQGPAGDPAEVQPDVERVRTAHLLEHPDRVLGRPGELAGLLAE